MKRTKEVAGDNIFGLSTAEQRVYAVLAEDTPYSVAQIVKSVRMPRTSVVRTLDSLFARGLADRQKIGRRFRWMRALVGVIEKRVVVNTEKLGVSLAGVEVSGLEILSGAEDLMGALWQGLRSLPRNGRFMGVQSAESADISLQKMGVQNVVAINEFIKERDLISEGVLSEQYIADVASKHGKEWLQSFAGRLAHTSTVPDTYLAYTADLYLFAQKSAMLVNWKEETGVRITNPDVIALLHAMFRFMHDSGRRIDNNALAEHILVKKTGQI